jgi:molybdenum cofactor sulfurtransferase
VIPTPRVLLYLAPFCALCERARQLLERAGIAFEEIDLSSERCCALAALTGGRSAPQIVINGRPIGGFDELAALQRAGRIGGPTSAEMDSDRERRSMSQPAAPEIPHPHQEETALLDELRRTEFGRLDAGGHVYLDYTGAGLYADSQLREHLELLQQNVFGNPHSLNPTSVAMTELVEQARAAVLAFFRASPDEYVAVFTPNATGALRLVGEAYPFHEGDRFLLTFDNHNSVNGIREFARARGAETTYVPSEPPELRVDERLLPRYLTEVGGEHNNLFAYPAQSNFSGVQHPLAWIEQAQTYGWDVLLDAAAFVPTNRLDLSRWHPDFVALSFYKMFGWPSGVGALVARREALARLERPWFSGGTIVAAFVQREWYQSAPGAAHFEDGTVNFLNLPAIEIGLRFLDRIGIDTVHAHVQTLAAPLLDTLGSLRHTNGAPAATIYGPRELDQRGATVAFNFLHQDGRVVDERYVDRLARRHNISLRTGCFCNPGAGEVAFTISRETLVGGEFSEGVTLDDYVEAIGLPSGGAVRASLGLASNLADIERFIAFAREFVDLAAVPDDLPRRLGC